MTADKPSIAELQRQEIEGRPHPPRSADVCERLRTFALNRPRNANGSFQ